MKFKIIWFRIFWTILVLLAILEFVKFLYYRDAIDGQLARAQNSGEAEQMKKELSILKLNLEKHDFTSGYTSFIYQLAQVDGANMANFYEGIKHRLAELAALDKEAKTEKSFSDIKLEIEEMTPPLVFYYFTQSAPWFFILFCLTYLWPGISLVSYAGWEGGFMKILSVKLKEFDD